MRRQHSGFRASMIPVPSATYRRIIVELPTSSASIFQMSAQFQQAMLDFVFYLHIVVVPLHDIFVLSLSANLCGLARSVFLLSLGVSLCLSNSVRKPYYIYRTSTLARSSTFWHQSTIHDGHGNHG